MNKYKISREYLDLEQLLDEQWKTVRDPYKVAIGCDSYPIIIANGKQGLSCGNWRVILEPKYLRIIKLTYRHYLCQEQSNYILYELHQDGLGLEPLAIITTTEALTLDGLLQILLKDHSLAHEALSKNLHRRGGALYISDYRWFNERITDELEHAAAVQRVAIDNNFHIRLWDVNFV